MWLIVMFWIGFLVVITKPLLPASEIAIALVNGSAILIVLFYILVLIDLTQLVFRIDPIFKMLPNENEEQ